MEKVIYSLKKREVLLPVLGMILARAVVFSMNPIAMAYFAAIYPEKNIRLLVFLGTLLGMATAMPMIDVIKYGLVMIVVSFVAGLGEKSSKRVIMPVMGCLAGTVTMALNITKGVFYINYKYYILLAILEGMLILVLSVVFHKGIHYFLYAKKGQVMNNEELISLAIVLAICAYGMPAISTGGFSLAPMIGFLFVLFMGYKYGSGSGAIAGATCGVVSSIGTDSLNMIGIMCILGIVAGMLREVGRFATSIGFLVSCILLGYMYEESLLQVEQVRALVSSIVIFVLFPKRYVYRVDLATKSGVGNPYAKENLQRITKNKLQEFSDSFHKLSKTFYHIAETKTTLEKKDVDCVFEEISDKLCKNCVKCNYCWKNNYYNTYQAAYSIIGEIDREGILREENVPKNFSKCCIHYENFIEETKRSLELAKVNLGWHNRMAESREAIASQLGEVANIIREFASDIYETREILKEQEEQVKNLLMSNQIEVKKIAIFEKRTKREEVYLKAKTRRGRCITTKEAAAYIGQVTGKRFRPSDSTKNIIPKEYEELIFVEDVNFKTLTGVARMKKEGEEVCGDNFSYLQLNSGEMIMTLADGMGSGTKANTESESVVELLEQFVEAGFKEISAIKLINSVLVLKSDKHSFSTVDMGVINLYTGMCEFIKVGAAATFIKRDRWVETICSTSMPAGIFNQVDFDGVSKKLYHGDMVVMMTDGVLDCFPGEQKEEYIENILMGTERNNPKEIADYILETAIACSGGQVLDDMTVMVTGIWEKVS